MFEQFPYSNFHDLNLDWIIKIAKDFLDQYTHIQDIISGGESSLQNLTETGLAELRALADQLETLLQQWYDTHSEDIANQLANAIAQFNTSALQIAQDASQSIPEDYSDLTRLVNDIRERLYDTQRTILDNYRNLQLYPVWYQRGINGNTGLDNDDPSQISTDFIYVDGENVNFIPKSGYLLHARWYNNRAVSTFVSGQNSVSGMTESVAPYLKLVCTKSDFTNITPSDGSGNSLKIYRSRLNQGFIMSTDSNNDLAPANVTVDTTTKTITFGAQGEFCRLFCNNNTPYNVNGKTLDYTGAPSYIHILFDTETSEFTYYGSTQIPAPQSRYISIGTIWSNNNTVVNLRCYPDYTVNGLRTTPDDSRYILSDIHEKNLTGVCRIGILGDSISTYQGTSESAIDGQQVRAPYYPASDVTELPSMWYNVARKCLRTGSDYIVSAISRSSFRDIEDATMPPVWSSGRINRLAAFINMKYIFIECGVNDQWDSMANIGTPSGKWDITQLEAESNTACRGMELTIRKLQNAIPNAKIVVLIPPCTFGDTVTNRVPYMTLRKQMTDIAQMYGVFRVIDLAQCITAENRSRYTIDGIHPNKAGMEKIGKYVATCLMQNNEQIN